MNDCPVCGLEGISPDKHACPQCDSDLACFRVLDSLPEPGTRERISLARSIAVGSLGLLLAIAVVLGAVNLNSLAKIEDRLAGQNALTREHISELESEFRHLTAANLHRLTKIEDGLAERDASTSERLSELDAKLQRLTAVNLHSLAKIEDRLAEENTLTREHLSDLEARLRHLVMESPKLASSEKDSPDRREDVPPQAPVGESNYPVPDSNQGAQPTNACTSNGIGVFAGEEPLALQEPPAQDEALAAVDLQSRGLRGDSVRAELHDEAKEPPSLNPGGLAPASTEATGTVIDPQGNDPGAVGPEFWVYDANDGDTFWSISRRFYGTGHYYPVLMEHNPDVGLYSVRKGTQLKILKDAGRAKDIHQRVVKSEGHRLVWYYTAMEGDTLDSIAGKYYRAVENVKRLAELNSGIELRAGERLRIELE